MHKKDIAFFKRFLKDKGLYSAFKRSNNISKSKCHNIMPFKKFIKTHSNPCDIIMYCIIWDEIKFKSGFFWGDIYIEFKQYYKKNIGLYKRKKNEKNN